MTWIEDLDDSWQDMFANTDLDSSQWTFEEQASDWDGTVFATEVASMDSDALDFLTFMGSSAGDTASFLVNADQVLTIGNFFSNMSSAGLFLGVDAESIIELTEIAANTSITFSLAARARLVLRNLILQGRAILSGTGAVDMNVSFANPGSFFLVNGGVGMNGYLSNATVEIIEEWGYKANASIGNLSSSGVWLNPAANVTLDGEFNFSGFVFQPFLMMEQGSRFDITSGNFAGGNFSMRAGNLAVHEGGNCSFDVMTECDAEATIYFVVEELDDLVEGERFTIFNYSENTKPDTFACTVILTDEDGDEMTVTFGSTPAASRRILSTDCAVSGSWEDYSLEVEACSTNSDLDSGSGLMPSLMAFALLLSVALFQ